MSVRDGESKLELPRVGNNDSRWEAAMLAVIHHIHDDGVPMFFEIQTSRSVSEDDANGRKLRGELAFLNDSEIYLIMCDRTATALSNHMR